MKTQVIMTEDIISLLFNEGWLSTKQLEDMNNYIGCEFSRHQIETLCADYNVVEIVFEDTVEPYNITYHVHSLSKGLYKEGKPEVFTDVHKAIKYQYKMSKKVAHLLWVIEVNYEGGI